MENTKKVPFSEMSNEDKVRYILLGQNDPYFIRNHNFGLLTEPKYLLKSLSLNLKRGTNYGTPRLKDEEVLEIVKGMYYCTFYHTGGYNRYHNLIADKKVSRFQMKAACTVEQFINYKGRQVPNSEVKFFLTLEEAKRDVYK
jgi:hypothetical protein